MDFGLNAEQSAMQERIVTVAGAWEPTPDRYFTTEQWKRLGDAGLLGLNISAEHGGCGHDAQTTALAVEALGFAYPDMALVFAAMAHLFACATPIAEHGAQELRDRVLPALCTGEWVAANAITEVEAGSDVTAVQTTAVLDGDDYVIEGTKSFVSNAPAADLFLVYASTDPKFRHLGITAFVVERDRPGVLVGEPFAKLGMGSCPAAEVRFDRCRVPSANVVGHPGEGAGIFASSMGWERTCLFAGFLGSLRRQLEDCVEHARRRRQFGRPLSVNQAVTHRIADMKVRLDAARLLLLRACWARDEHDSADVETAVAKLAVSEAAVTSALDAMQVLGAWGYRGGCGADRAVRDAIGGRIFSGTSDIQRELIAKGLGL